LLFATGQDIQTPQSPETFVSGDFFLPFLRRRCAWQKKSFEKCAFLLQPIVFATTAGLCVLYKVLLLKFGLKMACMCGGILVL